MVNSLMLPILVGAGVGVLVGIAEALHARRIHRIARLAFGPRGRPALWVKASPVLRTVAATAAAWGATVLVTYDPVETDTEPDPKASKEVLIALDVSPSMQLKDAGPDTDKITRAAWAGKLVQGILDRLDMKTTRISVVAFYTKALPVLKETYDKNVVANLLDGLPMYIGFEPGGTDLNKGMAAAMDMARPWARKSTLLVVISDGDAEHQPAAIARPDSIAEAIVIGVGDPNRGQIVGGHNSRQDTPSLKQLAARLGGYYHQGNERHLPSEVLQNITMISPGSRKGLSVRDFALIAVGGGCSVLGLMGPALITLGRFGEFAAARRRVSRRSAQPGWPAAAERTLERVS